MNINNLLIEVFIEFIVYTREIIEWFYYKNNVNSNNYLMSLKYYTKSSKYHIYIHK